MANTKRMVGIWELIFARALSGLFNLHGTDLELGNP